MTSDAIAQGRLATLGLMDAATQSRAVQLLDDVANSDVETIRVLFADQHGVLRGKTIVASAFTTVFTTGLAAPSTLLLKDTAHKTVFDVWSGDPGPIGMAGAGDILLVPDPTTFRILPWSPHSAWIFCDARRLDGSAIPFSPRAVLKDAIARLGDAGLAMTTGLEVEFHVYQRTDPALTHADATMPGAPVQTRNLAQGYQFLTETRYAETEAVLDTLRRTAQQMDLPVRSMEIEMGPSQFEFTFDPAGPLAHADAMMMFRTMVKEVCAGMGLHATFMCRPNVENACASGWHLHQSITDLQGRNLMTAPDDTLTDTASGWIAGLLAHAPASCLLTTPTVNGYKRYRPHQLAPDRIQWGRDNRGAMLRALLAPGDPAARIENRAPEPAANPYYVFASQILSGLDGVTRGLSAPPCVNAPYDAEAPALPGGLPDAIAAFEASAFYRAALGDVCVDYLVRIKRAEWARYAQTVSDWEQREYFAIF